MIEDASPEDVTCRVCAWLLRAARSHPGPGAGAVEGDDDQDE